MKASAHHSHSFCLRAGLNHFADALARWGFMFALNRPVRQAFVNGLVPSAQRATVLSFDNLMTSAGGMVSQPVLGRVADASGYAASYLVCAGVHLAALPFLLLAHHEKAASDTIDAGPPPAPTVP